MTDTGIDTGMAWRLLELVSIHDTAPSDADVDMTGVDWNQLMSAALRHRLLPRLADYLVRSDLMSFAPREFCRVLVRSLHENRFRCASLTCEASRVVTALSDHEMVAACTKGLGFQSTLYGGFGGRSLGDIDLMIHEADKHRAAEVLLELGYLANLEHNLRTDTLTKRSALELATYRLYPDHLPHFRLPLTGQAISHHSVDICFNITWYGAAWQVPMSDVLATLACVDVVAGEEIVSLPVLTTPYDFVFTVMHLFREGWFQRTATSDDLRLGQFADLWRLWQRFDQAGVAELTALIDKYAIAPPVAWVCHHVDTIFGSTLVDDLGLRDYCDDAWLRSAGAVDGGHLSWEGDMRGRIRSGAPVLVPAPEPPFATAARVGAR